MTTRRILICFIGTVTAFLIITFTLHHPLKVLKSHIDKENATGSNSVTIFSRNNNNNHHGILSAATASIKRKGNKVDEKVTNDSDEENINGNNAERETAQISSPMSSSSTEKKELSPTEASSSSSSSSSTEDSNFITQTTDSDGNALPFPIYEPTEDKAPGDSQSMPASEQLECRQNVIEYVINATDVKDECDGLRRAFDVSCQTIELQNRRMLDATKPQTASFTLQQHIRRRLRQLSSLSLPTKKHVNSQTIKDSILLQDNSVRVNNYNKRHGKTNTFIKKKAPKRKHLSSQTKTSLKQFIATPEAEELKSCCASILSVFHEHCDRSDAEGYEDERLFVIVFVITLCGLVKSLIRHFKIRWLPEAAGCILVGVIFGLILDFVPHFELYFDEKMFLRLMLPPIVFEAALTINKHSFRRYATPIFIFACVGTIMTTCLTAIIVHVGSYCLSPYCPHIPVIESLAFGALISSIDPIAVLSVLSNMGVRQTDAIYILIFGESLLNDGVAIILFETLIHFLGSGQTLDSTSIKEATLHLCFLAFGSIIIGVICGLCCLVYFWAMHGCHSPLVEILSFCCWALIPFYIADGVGWSGIVSIVAAGFVMDMYVVGDHAHHTATQDSSNTIDLMQVPERQHSPPGIPYRCRRLISPNGQMSNLAKTHLHFVTSVISTLMETAIFSYLGLFLFQSRYHWNFRLTFISIFSCLASRAMMLSTLTYLSNWISRRKSKMYRYIRRSEITSASVADPSSDDTEFNPIIDKRKQVILWFAGLRGAMSFALVENIPLYDASTGYGTRFKSELKAMTSASILFTVFVLGGTTFYAMEHLGVSMNKNDDQENSSSSNSDTASLVRKKSNKKSEETELIRRG